MLTVLDYTKSITRNVKAINTRMKNNHKIPRDFMYENLIISHLGGELQIIDYASPGVIFGIHLNVLCADEDAFDFVKSHSGQVYLTYSFADTTFRNIKQNIAFPDEFMLYKVHGTTLCETYWNIARRSLCQMLVYLDDDFSGRIHPSRRHDVDSTLRRLHDELKE